MSYEFNTGMKVFSKLYVGFNIPQKAGATFDNETRSWSEYNFTCPLAFATPYEENAAGRKRQSTVDGWANKFYQPTNKKQVPVKPAEIIDNDLQPGFKITDDIKRVYYGGGNVVFRVADPRGFELEIQSQNLMTLISLVGINAGGEIPGKCCWGRDGGANILIHESSDEYKNARLAAETIKPIAGIKATFRRGDELILTNGNKVTYLGRFYFSGWKYGEDSGRAGSGEVVFNSPTTTIKEIDSNTSDYEVTGPVQFHVVKNEGLVLPEVILYREIKAASIIKPIDEELSINAALTIIGAGAMNTAGASDTYYTLASDNKQNEARWVIKPVSAEMFDNILKKSARHPSTNPFHIDVSPLGAACFKLDDTIWTVGPVGDHFTQSTLYGNWSARHNIQTPLRTPGRLIEVNGRILKTQSIASGYYNNRNTYQDARRKVDLQLFSFNDNAGVLKFLHELYNNNDLFYFDIGF